MHRVAAVLLSAVMLSAGCADQPASVNAPEPPKLTAPPEPRVAYVAIIGDSFTSGSQSDGSSGSRAWPVLVTSILKGQGVNIEVAVGASSGSGYVSHSTKGSVPFVNQIPRVVGTNDELVILFGSPYDQTALPDRANDLDAAVEHTLEEVKKAAPKAQLLIIGPAWVPADPAPEILHARDIIKGRADAVAAVFVDPLADGWFADHPEMVGANGDSPNEAGQQLMANRIAPVVAQLLTTLPTS